MLGVIKLSSPLGIIPPKGKALGVWKEAPVAEKAPEPPQSPQEWWRQQKHTYADPHFQDQPLWQQGIHEWDREIPQRKEHVPFEPEHIQSTGEPVETPSAVTAPGIYSNSPLNVDESSKFLRFLKQRATKKNQV